MQESIKNPRTGLEWLGTAGTILLKIAGFIFHMTQVVLMMAGWAFIGFIGISLIGATIGHPQTPSVYHVVVIFSAILYVFHNLLWGTTNETEKWECSYNIWLVNFPKLKKWIESHSELNLKSKIPEMLQIFIGFSIPIIITCIILSVLLTVPWLSLLGFGWYFRGFTDKVKRGELSLMPGLRKEAWKMFFIDCKSSFESYFK